MRPTRSVMCTLLLCMGLLSLTISCSKKESESEKKASTFTEAQRDSAIAASQLPGATAVGRAIAVSDSAKARAKRANDVQP